MRAGSIPTALICLVLPIVSGCDAPSTTVVLTNDYSSAIESFTIFRASWLAVSFPTPIPPGGSTDPQDTFAASPNDAYVIVAPGWDGTTTARTPTDLVVLQSRQGFELHWNTRLHIPVDDMTFAGNCAAGSLLTQEQADFITQRVFASTFTGLRYDAATCSTTAVP